MNCMCSECVANRGDDMGDVKALNQTETSRYLIEYRNPDGSLLLPQFGGCWHTLQYEHGQNYSQAGCIKCRHSGEIAIFKNPNLFTWANFGLLWEAMQARDDWWKFERSSSQWTNHIRTEHINPLTFPATVRAYLKGEK